MFNKPNVQINMNYSPSVVSKDASLNTLLLGPKYNVVENYSAGEYDKAHNTTTTYSTGADTSYTKLTFKDIFLQYYASAHTWRKCASNKIRAILSDNVIVKNSTNYPITIDQEAKVGDFVDVVGKAESSITGFVADSVASSIGSSTALSSNTATVSASINDVSGSGLAVTGPYTGDLGNNILEDDYEVLITASGVAPVCTVTQPSTPPKNITVNSIFDSPNPDTYRIIIVDGGDAGVATYQVISTNGDNEGVQVTPAATVAKAIGTKGLKFTISSTVDDFVSGQEWVIACTPSAARVKLIGTGEVINSRVFPGFSHTFSIGNMGIKLNFTGASLTAGQSWTFNAVKQIDAVTSTSSGTFTGLSNTNLFVKVVKGGIWGACAVEVTGGSSRRVITVLGYGSGNSINLGDGVYLYFATNAQGGLILNDTFVIACSAAQNTAYRTITLAHSLPADVVSFGTVTNPPGENTISVSGTYDSTNPALHLYQNEVYTLTCTTGGEYGAAVLTVSTLSGNDNGTITPALGANNYGNYGLVLTLVGSSDFTLGKVWTFTVTKTNLTVHLSASTVDTIMSKTRVEDESQTAWSNTGTAITINSALKLYNSASVLQNIYKANMYVTYRELQTSGANTISTNLGTSHVDNPIKYGYDIAALNSDGAPIKCMFVSSDDAAGYDAACKALESVEEVFRICLLSNNESAISSVVTHVNKMATKNKWRICFINHSLPTTLPVATGTGVISVYTDNTYRLFTSSDINTALVQVGDKISYLGTIQTVEEVISSTELLLVDDYGVPQSIAAESVVYRIPTSDTLAQWLAFKGASYSNRFVYLVYPDTFNGNIPGYYATAAIGGLKAGVPCQQPVSNYTIAGLPEMDYLKFNEDQMDIIANGGVFIITQNGPGLSLYIRHQVSTDVSDVKKRELSMVEAYCKVAYSMYNVLIPFVGKYNIHPGVIGQIDVNMRSVLSTLATTETQSSGPVILSYEINSIEAIADDKLKIVCTLTLVSPLNEVVMELIA